MTDLRKEIISLKYHERQIELYNQIDQLHQIQKDLNQLIYQQKESIDSIEENMSTSQIEVESGHTNLEIAKKYSFHYGPIVVGSAVGFAVGGPLAIFIPGIKAIGGLALGSVLSLGGGYVGYKIQK